MAWLRIDDTVPEHRKMLHAGPDACWLWVCGIAYCQRQLTDGFIPAAALSMIGVKGEARVTRLAETLVAVGLFERAEGGYRVHDYHDHNATRDEALDRRSMLRQTRSDAGKRGAEARWQNGKRDGKPMASTNGKPMAPSHPIPSQLREDPPTPHADARGAVRITRAIRKRAEEIRRLRFGQCRHEPACANHEACVVAIAAELAEKSA